VQLKNSNKISEKKEKYKIQNDTKIENHDNKVLPKRNQNRRKLNTNENKEGSSEKNINNLRQALLQQLKWVHHFLIDRVDSQQTGLCARKHKKAIRAECRGADG
jgi:hypothetical protein